MSNSLLHDEAASTAIEYSLIAALIALAIVSTLAVIGEHVLAMYADAAAAVGGSL